jgi:hypothetical protein
MMYAVDRIGLDVIKDIPYDCLDLSIEFGDSIIHSYERKMGQTMLIRDHALASFLGPFLQPQESMPQRTGGSLRGAMIDQSSYATASLYNGGPMLNKG